MSRLLFVTAIASAEAATALSFVRAQLSNRLEPAFQAHSNTDLRANKRFTLLNPSSPSDNHMDRQTSAHAPIYPETPQ